MAQFQCVENQMGSASRLKFIGPIDETAHFPKITASATNVSIHMGEVTRLNSNGTRQWVIWARTIPPATTVILEECPVIFVKSFALIKGVLLPNMQVHSFYVPYFSDASAERKNVLVRIGEDYFPDGRLKLPTVRDSKGATMDVDALQASYFAFLKR